jgi:hypothetical protein
VEMGSRASGHGASVSPDTEFIRRLRQANTFKCVMVATE